MFWHTRVMKVGLFSLVFLVLGVALTVRGKQNIQMSCLKSNQITCEFRETSALSLVKWAGKIRHVAKVEWEYFGALPASRKEEKFFSSRLVFVDVAGDKIPLHHFYGRSNWSEKNSLKQKFELFLQAEKEKRWVEKLNLKNRFYTVGLACLILGFIPIIFLLSMLFPAIIQFKMNEGKIRYRVRPGIMYTRTIPMGQLIDIVYLEETQEIILCLTGGVEQKISYHGQVPSRLIVKAINNLKYLLVQKKTISMFSAKKSAA
jgi:hypothetical protein